MFDVRHIDLADGAYTDSRINGAECAIMTHMEALDNIINEFKRLYTPNEDIPEELLSNIIFNYGIDITQTDANYISAKLNYYYC